MSTKIKTGSPIKIKKIPTLMRWPSIRYYNNKGEISMIPRGECCELMMMKGEELLSPTGEDPAEFDTIEEAEECIKKSLFCDTILPEKEQKKE